MMEQLQQEDDEEDDDSASLRKIREKMQPKK
jgi:hypothetical protein